MTCRLGRGKCRKGTCSSRPDSPPPHHGDNATTTGENIRMPRHRRNAQMKGQRGSDDGEPRSDPRARSQGSWSRALARELVPGSVARLSPRNHSPSFFKTKLSRASPQATPRHHHNRQMKAQCGGGGICPASSEDPPTGTGQTFWDMVPFRSRFRFFCLIDGTLP